MEDQSGALIGSNDDLLSEILLRLPVTSILRFKSVSKHWRWLLSHRCFTLRYDTLSKSPSPGLFILDSYVPFDVENPNPPPFRTLDFYSDPCDITIVQSCNGLLLCCSDGGGMIARKYYVFNPTTNQFAIIPSLPGGRAVCNTIIFMGLAFHQTECVHYKLVCIRFIEPDRPFHQIQVYSSDTGKWKISIESICMNPAFFDNPVYWNGAIHWKSCYRNHMSFKFDVEQLQSLPLPVEMTSSETMTRYFGESRGHLHLIVGVNYQHNIPLSLNVYEMLSDCSGWFVKYRLELDELPGSFPEMIARWDYNFYVCDVVRGEKEEDSFVVLIIPGKVITYNVHDKSFKQIFDLTAYHYEAYLKR